MFIFDYCRKNRKCFVGAISPLIPRCNLWCWTQLCPSTSKETDSQEHAHRAMLRKITATILPPCSVFSCCKLKARQGTLGTGCAGRGWCEGGAWSWAPVVGSSTVPPPVAVDRGENIWSSILACSINNTPHHHQSQSYYSSEPHCCCLDSSMSKASDPILTVILWWINKLTPTEIGALHWKNFH